MPSMSFTADYVIAANANDVNRADVAAGATDGGGDFAQRAGARREFDADG
jgi:hypothetical protein